MRNSSFENGIPQQVASVMSRLLQRSSIRTVQWDQRLRWRQHSPGRPGFEPVNPEPRTRENPAPLCQCVGSQTRSHSNDSRTSKGGCENKGTSTRAFLNSLDVAGCVGNGSLSTSPCRISLSSMDSCLLLAVLATTPLPMFWSDQQPLLR